MEPDLERFLLICHPDKCAQQLNSRPLGSLGHNISQISKVDFGREVWLNGKGNIKKSFEKVLKRPQLPLGVHGRQDQYFSVIKRLFFSLGTERNFRLFEVVLQPGQCWHSQFLKSVNPLAPV